MILLLRFYAPRVSDVTMLERSHLLVMAGRRFIFFHAQKNGMPVCLPVYPEVMQALECLPLPRKEQIPTAATSSGREHWLKGQLHQDGDQNHRGRLTQEWR